MIRGPSASAGLTEGEQQPARLRLGLGGSTAECVLDSRDRPHAFVASDAWLAATPLIPKEAWLSAIEEFLKPALREPSREAFLRGHNWMTERAETHS